MAPRIARSCAGPGTTPSACARTINQRLSGFADYLRVPVRACLQWLLLLVGKTIHLFICNAFIELILVCYLPGGTVLHSSCFEQNSKCGAAVWLVGFLGTLLLLGSTAWSLGQTSAQCWWLDVASSQELPWERSSAWLQPCTPETCGAWQGAAGLCVTKDASALLSTDSCRLLFNSVKHKLSAGVI